MIVVTGAAGFIGSNLLEALESQDHSNLIGVDFFRADERWRNVAKRHSVDWIPPSDLFKFLEKNTPSAIFHLGAISSTTNTDIDELFHTNYTLSKKLWAWCTRHKIPFIYASSAATYGDGKAEYYNDYVCPSDLHPLNAYGWSKNLFDQWVYQQAEKNISPPQWVGLKFFNVYGPNEYHKIGQLSVVASSYRQIIETGRILLFESDRPDLAHGEQLRDFVWVDDCTDVMLWFLKNPSISGLFNVGTGVPRSFNELGSVIFSLFHQTPTIEYIPLPPQLKGKYQYYTCASLDKLRAVGYAHPMTSLEAGVTRYVQDFLSKGDPYR